MSKDDDLKPTQNEEETAEETTESGSDTSRRQFLHVTAAGAVVAVVGTSCSKEDFGGEDAGDSPDDAGSDDDGDTGNESTDESADDNDDNDSDNDTEDGDDGESEDENDDKDVESRTDGEDDDTESSDDESNEDDDDTEAEDTEESEADDTEADDTEDTDNETGSSDEDTEESDDGSDDTEDSESTDDTGEGSSDEETDDTEQPTTGSDTGTGEDTSDTQVDTGDAPSNRVVRVIDSGATSWSPGDSFNDFYQYGVQDVVTQMFERGLQALTGTSSIEAAWQSIIPNYNDGELVLIHPNCFANQANGQKNNIYQSLSPIVSGLVDVLGIPAQNVVVSDPSRPVAGETSPSRPRLVEQCPHTNDISWDLYAGDFGSNIQFTQGHNPGQMQIARIIEEASHVIVFPVLSWHMFNWITGALKVLIGSVSDMGATHGDSLENGPVLADICMTMKSKLRLIVGDGLFGNFDGNMSPPHAFETLGGDGGNHPSSTLYLSRDIVAIDCVMYDDLLIEARAAGQAKSGYAKGFLYAAADDDHQLGTAEMLDDTGESSYSQIELIDV